MTYAPDQIARVAHEAIRALRTVHDRPYVPPPAEWDAIEPQDRMIAVVAVRKALGGQSPSAPNPDPLIASEQALFAGIVEAMSRVEDAT